MPLLPFAITALFAAALWGCESKVEEPEPKPKKPKKKICPPDSKIFSFPIQGQSLQVCHQEPAGQQDGIFQAKKDQLGLLVEGYYTGIKKSDHHPQQNKFRLPIFEGLQVENWHRHYLEVFPQGSSLKEFQQWNRLVEHAHFRGVPLDQILPLAKKIRASSYQEIPGTKDPWNGMNGNEKILALNIALYLLAAPKHNFYQKKTEDGANSNKVFLDTITKLIEAGVLSLHDDHRTPLQDNEKPFLSGYMYYEIQDNRIRFDLNRIFKPLSMEVILTHELYHLFQDYNKYSGSLEQMEMEAHRKAAEYFLDHFEEERAGGKPGDLDAMIKTSFEEDIILVEHPHLVATWMEFYRRNGSTDQFKKFEQDFIQRINHVYFINPEVRNAAPLAQEGVESRLKGISQVTGGDLKRETFIIEGIIATTEQELAKTLAKLDRLQKKSPEPPDPLLAQEIKDSVYDAIFYKIGTVTLRFNLAHKKAGGDLNSDSYLEGLDPFFDRLSRYRPTRYIPRQFDGIDPGSPKEK